MSPINCCRVRRTRSAWLLVTGDPETREKVQAHPCITLDGCPKLCAKKNVELSGGKIAKGIRVYDTMKRHRGANFGTPTTLSEEGWAAARKMAAEVAETARQLIGRTSRRTIMAEISKVGIISCSGEEIPGGTISRLATRRVLELLRAANDRHPLPAAVSGGRRAGDAASPGSTPPSPWTAATSSAPSGEPSNIAARWRPRWWCRTSWGIGSQGVIVRHGTMINPMRKPSGFWPSGSPLRSIPSWRRSRKSQHLRRHPPRRVAVPAAVLPQKAT